MPTDKQNTLPKGWEAFDLNELGMVKTERIDPSKYPSKKFELWSVPSFETGKPEIAEGSEIGSTKQIVQEGDVLLCRINPRLNRVWVVEDPQGIPQIASTEWVVLRHPDYDSYFLRHSLSAPSFYRMMCDNVSGVGGSLTRTRKRSLREFEVALPPLSEQQRITERIDAIKSHSRKARETLTRLPALLAEYRQGVLHKAFSGRLTADWRTEQPEAESATFLLERIEEEHRAQWEADYVESRYHSKDKEPPSGWKDRYSPPEPVELDKLDALPKNWKWTSLEQLGRWTGGSTPRRSKDEYWEDGTIPWVSPKDMKSIEIHETEDYMTALAFDEDNQSLVPEGSILFVTRSGILRRTLPIAITRTDITINQDLKALIPVPSINQEFLLYWALAKEHDLRFDTMKQGTTVESIQSSKLYPYPIALPPAEEQQEIVRRVEQRLNRIDKLTKHVEGAQARMDSLDRAVLAKAFRGDLVETEAASAERARPNHESDEEQPLYSNGQVSQEAGKQTEMPLE